MIAVALMLAAAPVAAKPSDLPAAYAAYFIAVRNASEWKKGPYTMANTVAAIETFQAKPEILKAFDVADAYIVCQANPAADVPGYDCAKADFRPATLTAAAATLRRGSKILLQGVFSAKEMHGASGKIEPHHH